MEITVSQQVTITGDPYPHRWHKIFKRTVIPHIGDYIQDTIWDGSEYYKVIEVIIHYQCHLLNEKFI